VQREVAHRGAALVERGDAPVALRVDLCDNTNMKAIQVSMDENLLGRLDADDEVRRDGRSAVLRRAVEAYLRRKRRDTIARGYEKAYGRPVGDGLGREWSGWADEGAWPDE
jgi:predicted transcriptional regulator